MYVTRQDRLLPVGFCSGKLRKHQVTWLLCKLEALSIAAAVNCKHLSPYIIQSKHLACVLADSWPCVPVVCKLPRIQLCVVFPFKYLPFTSRPAWFSIQDECPDLHRVCAYLKQSARLSKPLTNIKDVERYLSVTSISLDGLLVVQRQLPLSPPLS